MKPHLIAAFALFGAATIVQAAGSSDLIRLYEEEVLAHDLYVALGKAHPKVMPLRNIPRSEQSHRGAMEAVLKAEGIALPKPGKGSRFVTPGLDETYAKWLAEGRESEAAACLVGTRLEDHDIADLRQAQLDFPKHKQVLSQLEAASNNHLRAFHRNLTMRGGSYPAGALPKDELQAILDDQGGGCGKCFCGAPGKGNGKGQRAGMRQGNGRRWHGGR